MVSPLVTQYSTENVCTFGYPRVCVFATGSDSGTPFGIEWSLETKTAIATLMRWAMESQTLTATE